MSKGKKSRDNLMLIAVHEVEIEDALKLFVEKEREGKRGVKNTKVRVVWTAWRPI